MHSQDRLHAMDAVRAFALLGGVALHASMSFILPIPVQDASQSTALGLLFYVIHLFRMAAFYLVAGYFGRLLLERRGARDFIRDRSRRIALPMVAFWIVLAPLTIGAVVYGVLTQYDPEAMQQLADSGLGGGGLPLVHLWFLYYLCLFYALVLSGRWLLAQLGEPGRVLGQSLETVCLGLLRSRLAAPLLALPVFAVLSTPEPWPYWYGIPTPETGLLPKLPATVTYGIAFGFGWLLQRRPEALGALREAAPFHLLCALPLTALCLSLGGVRGNIFQPAFPGSEAELLAYTAAYALALWSWTFAFIGLALRWLDRPSPRLRWLADASYWLYLVHLPLIFWLQVLLAPLPWHWGVKYPLILGVTLTLGLLSYRYWLRYTWLGALLNGRRAERGGARQEAGAGVLAS